MEYNLIYNFSHTLEKLNFGPIFYFLTHNILMPLLRSQASVTKLGNFGPKLEFEKNEICKFNFNFIFFCKRRNLYMHFKTNLKTQTLTP